MEDVAPMQVSRIVRRALVAIVVPSGVVLLHACASDAPVPFVCPERISEGKQCPDNAVMCTYAEPCYGTYDCTCKKPFAEPAIWTCTGPHGPRLPCDAGVDADAGDGG